MTPECEIPTGPPSGIPTSIAMAPRGFDLNDVVRGLCDPALYAEVDAFVKNAVFLDDMSPQQNAVVVFVEWQNIAERLHSDDRHAFLDCIQRWTAAPDVDEANDDSHGAGLTPFMPYDWTDTLNDEPPPPEPQEVVLSGGNGGKVTKSAAGNDSIPPEFTEDALALRFSEAHAHELRYVAAWGQWCAWTGTHWEHEKTLRVYDLARKICRAAAEQCRKPAVSSTLRKARTVGAIEMLVRSDRRQAATTNQWDANQWILNTPGGTVDLKTGKTRPHRADEYCTKITAVAPGKLPEVAGIPRRSHRLQCRSHRLSTTRLGLCIDRRHP
jgi:D5 N terminal like